jgi:predicted nucleotidyltransferase
MMPSAQNNTGSSFGVKQGDLRSIIDVIKQHLEVEEALIFGSRAKGNYKNGSDIDIALKGDAVTDTTISNISYILNEETQMPYQFDVLNYHSVVNGDLVKHIDRAGISFYKRG